jgi:hypothetical protein
MTLTEADISHIKLLVTELLFKLEDDEGFWTLEDLEDEIKIVAEIVGVNPNLEEDEYEA